MTPQRRGGGGGINAFMLRVLLKGSSMDGHPVKLRLWRKVWCMMMMRGMRGIGSWAAYRVGGYSCTGTLEWLLPPAGNTTRAPHTVS